MEQDIVIYIGVYKALTIVMSAIVSITYASWQAASRLAHIETTMENLANRMNAIEARAGGIFASKSPIVLLPKGQAILEQSGLKQYIDCHKHELCKRCRLDVSVADAYGVQEAAIKALERYDFGRFEAVLRAAAFRNGISLPALKCIGSVYLRDLYLSTERSVHAG